MPILMTEHLTLSNEGTEIELFLNAQGNLFVAPVDIEDASRFWFTITPEDWVVMKSFIDKQFSG